MNVHNCFAEFFEDEIIRPYAYFVSKRLSEGHICFDLNIPISEEDKSGSGYESFIPNVAELRTSDLVTTLETERLPFVLRGSNLYLKRYYNYESAIIEKIDMLIASENRTINERIEFLENAGQVELIKNLNAGIGPHMVNDAPELKMDWQLMGAINSFIHNFSIITGGPGTGKTTTVAKILALLYAQNPNLKVAMAAPTGKASARMIESLELNRGLALYGIEDQVKKLKPFTIHRLLGYIHNSPYFKHNQNNYLDYDVVIVDEASMIDVALFSKLLSAINPEKRVIFLGDKNQLSSVEAGSLFGDLCNALEPINQSTAGRLELINSFIADTEASITNNYVSENTGGLLFQHIVELKKSHRFSECPHIALLGKSIIEGNEESVVEYINEQHQEVTIDSEYKRSVLKNFARNYFDYLTETDIKEALELLNRQKVLCAVRETEQGVFHINNEIEKILQEESDLIIDDEFYINRPILVTKNDRELGLWNGDIGIIRKDDDGKKHAYFIKEKSDEGCGNELRKVLPGYITQCETVFAMTIHKSQGSEYDKVLVILPDQERNKLLTRELFYTGVTRAKQSVIVQGGSEILKLATRKQVARASGLTKRIQ
ncbi:MAG: exodeoxyribonuclease V subunit alpha [Flavobacteriales bacterium]|nr:exodeoxyribonuclease V subunit alpha [Flavobacteriales bacterium]